MKIKEMPINNKHNAHKDGNLSYMIKVNTQ